MDPQSSNDDCYFYYYSSCIRGVDCQFRHCEAALGTETVCSLWKEGRCYRENCKFRHMESRIQRSAIPCYWENQPGGCRKPHCVFFHTKYRRDTSSENQGLILPVSNQGPTLVPNPTMGSVPSDVLKTPVRAQSTNYSNVDSLFTNENLSLSPASQPVEPVVVTLDEGEESDAESVSSAPMKSIPIKTDVKTSKDSEEKDFGVKTLEQLRMEKIHRESEHFYKSDDVSDAKVMAGNNRNTSLHEDSEMYFSDYCMPSHEDMQLDHKSESNVFKNFYPPDSSDVINLSNGPSPEENNSGSGVGLRSEILPSIRGDLRSRIKKSMGEQQTAVQEKRTLSLKRKGDPEEDSFDFKIKTLDEIRKEKLKKADESLTTKSPPPAYELTELQQALDNKRKIRKLFRDPFTAHKEEREVQKSLEQKLRIDPIKAIQNGSINGLSSEVLEKDVESSYPKTGETVKNSSPDVVTSSDDEDAIPTNKIKEDSGKSSLHSQNHGLSATLKNGSINKAANIILTRKLRPIARNKRTTDPVTAPVQEQTKKGTQPTNDSEIRTDTSASKQNISPSDEPMTLSPKKPLVTNMSDDDKQDIENQHLQDNKPKVEDQLLPGNKPASSDQQTVLGDKTPPVESTSTIEQKVEPMNIVAERSTSVEDFDNLFLNDSDMMLEESEAEHNDKKAEDIFLEIEQMLDS